MIRKPTVEELEAILNEPETDVTVMPDGTVRPEHWKQFSLYPPGCRNKFLPQQVLHSFLPRYIEEVSPRRWHVLFEPSALVRILCNDYDWALERAQVIAQQTGLVFELGDCSWQPGKAEKPGEDYYGAEGEQLDEKGWRAKTEFMRAASELSLYISSLDSYTKQLEETRRWLHVYLNSLGLNYLEEATLCHYYADRAAQFMKGFYRA